MSKGSIGEQSVLSVIGIDDEYCILECEDHLDRS